MNDNVKKFNQFVNENKTIEWTQEIQKDFEEWKRDGNVSKNDDGSYSTQDAQWNNKLKLANITAACMKRSHARNLILNH